MIALPTTVPARLVQDSEGWALVVDGLPTPDRPGGWYARVPLPYAPTVERSTVEGIIARTNPDLVIAGAGTLD